MAAIAQTPVGTPTPYMACIQITSDANPGGALTLTNAQLLTAASVAGPLRTALDALCADQATARARLLYGNPIRLSLQPQTGVGVGWFADANAAANEVTVEVTAGASASVAILRMEYRHTLVQ